MSEIISGRNPVLELLEAAKPEIDYIVFARSASGERIDKIRKLAKKRKIELQDVSGEQLSDRAGDKHQGVAARIKSLSPLDLNEFLSTVQFGSPARLVLLDKIQDPVNLGKIARTALYFGVDGLIKTAHGSAPLSNTVLKTSAGAAARLPVAEVSNLQNAIKKLKEKRFWFVGASLEGENKPEEIPVDRNLALVMGHEGEGLSRLTAKMCDYLVSIPGGGDFDSLNVGVAAGVLIYTLKPPD
ncbi:MAG: 23S rRNA (guanosine(2251)-2'-O)-methyltransferase RlmB [bacterium]